jgi:2,4-dienoyl-CoA reductase-like NADH-dependent reductase (Old Yellow Enzyme family)
MFEPGLIGPLEIPNRFIRSATAEFSANNNDGTVTPEYFNLYSDLAQGGIGLIIQGHLYIMDEGKSHDNMAGISQDYHMQGLKKLVNLIHDSDGLVGAQINHGGFHSISKKGPSEREEKETKVMTEDDIEKIITGFKMAAHRAKKAGYDAVQLHSAHGYLLSQFLSSRMNKRRDAWGGSLENRAQFLLSVFKAVKSIVGADYPVLVKMNGSDDPFDGYPIEEGAWVAKRLAEEGIDAIEISGMKSTRTFKLANEGYFAGNAKRIKREIGDTPLISVGGHRTYSKIQHLREFVDFVSLSRPFIREPDLIRKFKEGKERADCISCTKCMKVEGIIHCANL